MRMRSSCRKKLFVINNFYWAARRTFYWTTGMAVCSFEGVLQTIRGPPQRTSAFCRLLSSVRSYNQACSATGPRTVPCDTSQLHGRVLRAHGHLTSLTKRSTMNNLKSLIRGLNVPCSYSVLRDCWRCIHSTNSE